jgi:hypothetical protein
MSQPLATEKFTRFTPCLYSFLTYKFTDLSTKKKENEPSSCHREVYKIYPLSLFLSHLQIYRFKNYEPTSCRPAGQPVLWGRVRVDGPGSGRLGGAEGGPGGPHPLPPPLHDHCGDHLQGQGMSLKIAYLMGLLYELDWGF